MAAGHLPCAGERTPPTQGSLLSRHMGATGAHAATESALTQFAAELALRQEPQCAGIAPAQHRCAAQYPVGGRGPKHMRFVQGWTGTGLGRHEVTVRRGRARALAHVEAEGARLAYLTDVPAPRRVRALADDLLEEVLVERFAVHEQATAGGQLERVASSSDVGVESSAARAPSFVEGSEERATAGGHGGAVAPGGLHPWGRGRGPRSPLRSATHPPPRAAARAHATAASR